MNCRHCGGEINSHDSGIGKIDECRTCASDIEKYVGHMVWDHKTAPALEIHANRKSLDALKDGRYNNGELVHEVKDRSRRRESDVSVGAKPCLSPFIRPPEMVMHGPTEVLPKIALRSGNGKTVATFGRELLEKASKGGDKFLQHLSGDKMKLAKAASKMQLTNVAGFSITVWQDADGFYVVPKRSVTRSVLDDDTLRRLGFRGANFSR